MEGESGRTRGWGGTCRRDAVSSVRSSKLNQKKIQKERDGAMAIGGHNKTGGHNNQPKFGVGRGRDMEKERDCGRTNGGERFATA